MECSSPLSSPPPSSVLNGYEGDHAAPASSPPPSHYPFIPSSPAESSSPVDLVPTSPAVTGSPPAPSSPPPASPQSAPLTPISSVSHQQDADTNTAGQDEQLGSPPPYTDNAFALASPAPQIPEQKEKQKQKTAEAPAPAPASASRSKPPRRTLPRRALKSPQPDPTSATPLAAVTTTRSGRRVIQKRQPDDVGAAVSAAASPFPQRPRTTIKFKASPSAAAVHRRRKLEAARWQTDFVLASARSPLGNFDLRTLLCLPEAWTALSADEQKEVLALFPSTCAGSSGSNILDAGTDAARPDIASLKNDNNFRHDTARYRSDLQAGFFDKAWLEEAFEAHAMRHEGVFDAYVVEEFESSWGVAVPDEHKPASMRLPAAAVEEKTEQKQPEDAGPPLLKAKEEPEEPKELGEVVAKTEHPPNAGDADAPLLPGVGQETNEKTEDAPKKASLKRSRRSSANFEEEEEEAERPRLDDDGDGTPEATTRRRSARRSVSGTPARTPAATPEPTERKPVAKKQKQGGDEGDYQIDGDDGDGNGEKASAVALGDPVPEETERSRLRRKKEDKPEDKDMATAMAPAKVAPAKRKATTKVPMRGRKRKTPSAAGEESPRPEHQSASE